jgi:FkbM family methyltransferase
MVNKKYINFIYDSYTFNFVIDTSDRSGNGCIKEIVKRDDYKLYQFKNLDDKIIFDIGANCGVATVIMAKLNPNSTIYAFEPFKEVYNLLCENIKLNNLTNIKTYNNALLNDSKNMKLMIHKHMSGANSLIANETFFKKTYKHTDSTIINALSFDDFINNNNINEIVVLKIDCEGSEYDILYNSNKIKDNIVKNIVGEFHDFRDVPKTYNGKHLIKYCKQYIPYVNISILDLTNKY